MKRYFLMIPLLLQSTKAFSQEAVSPQQTSEIKGKWKPAVKNGTPVDSKFVMKVNFSYNTYDHD